MKETIMNNIVDLSRSDEFQFAVPCTVCGKTWVSSSVPFSKAEGIIKSELKRFIFRRKFNSEKNCAEAAAMEEAKVKLNFCPVCKSLVCDTCFMICEDNDMCVDCASYFHKQGECVEV